MCSSSSLYHSIRSPRCRSRSAITCAPSRPLQEQHTSYHTDTFGAFFFLHIFTSFKKILKIYIKVYQIYRIYINLHSDTHSEQQHFKGHLSTKDLPVKSFSIKSTHRFHYAIPDVFCVKLYGQTLSVDLFDAVLNITNPSPRCQLSHRNCVFQLKPLGNKRTWG